MEAFTFESVRRSNAVWRLQWGFQQDWSRSYGFCSVYWLSFCAFRMKHEAACLAYIPGEPRRIAREGSTPNYTQVPGAAPGMVRESRSVTGHGILTRRQKAWTDGRPNEGKIENPVHYK